MTTAELSVANARIVTPDSVVERGSLFASDGVIAAVDSGPMAIASALDFDGDYLLPGLIELHTDNLERHFIPGPNMRCPGRLAVLGHDAEIAAAGITTVLDAVALGDVRGGTARVELLDDMIAAITESQRAGLLRAEHLLHLRCEVSFDGLIGLFEPLLASSWVKLISIMDHTPGQRQFCDASCYRIYYQGRFGLSEQALEQLMADQIAAAEAHSAHNRRAVVELCRERSLALASHDDGTPEHVDEAVRDGMVVAEFPTTPEAASLSRHRGLKVMMGGPNLVRGRSHFGNLSARFLAEAGQLDILSSDYIPMSLIHAAFLLPEIVPTITLPQAVAMMSFIPAAAVGLTDRGGLLPGKRADLVRVGLSSGIPIVRAVWRAGRRVI